MSIRRLIMALVFATATIHSCGSGGDKTPLGSAGDGLPNAPPADAGQSISGFSVADELSPWGANSPFQGSKLELDTFPNLGFQTGGTKDSIPALTNPTFVGAAEIDYVLDDDLVLGLVIDGIARAYPENIGWWHEIVNDEVGGYPVSVTFCPLTGTGLALKAADGGQLELGVSGLLFNNNLVMYDRRDNETLYPQIYFTGISGGRKGESLTLLPITETKWSTWKRLHPDTQVIALGGETYRNEQVYRQYPYQNYLTSEIVLRPLDPSHSHNPNPFALDYGRKSPMLGLRLAAEIKAYVFEDMGERIAINDRLGGQDILVIWDQESFLALPYWREVDGQSLTFEIDPGVGFPFSLVDEGTGSRWNVHGVATDGPMAGVRLTQIPAHNSFWFAWLTFWQDTDVWKP